MPLGRVYVPPPRTYANGLSAQAGWTQYSDTQTQNGEAPPRTIHIKIQVEKSPEAAAEAIKGNTAAIYSP